MSMTGHIFIYGGIGTGQGEVSINNIKSQIDPAASDYIVHIVSPGGDVFEGYGIYNMLRNTGKKVTTQVEGLCASIATLIAFAGDKIIMNKTSEFMIHNPKISDLKGESSDLRNVADQLDKIKGILIDVSGQRAARNGKIISKEKLWELYDNETWLNAHEAQSMGFVDEVQEAIKAVAKVDLTHINMEKNTLWSKITNLLKFKNDFEETLQDGTAIIVISEDENWTGKQVVTREGTPLADGEHVLASGKTIMVSGGVITEVKEGTAASAEGSELDNKIAELETQLASLKAEKETAQAAATAAQAKVVEAEGKVKTAEAKAARLENRTAEIEKEFIALKEQMGVTVGDTTPPAAGPSIKNVSDNKQFDPMGDFAAEFLKGRN
jgi:ATP-dependent protease ClpP protease subunit/uncharacterized protein YheU (UPF0270 family)